MTAAFVAVAPRLPSVARGRGALFCGPGTERRGCIRGAAAFSLLELLVVVTILGMIITLTALLLGGGRKTGDSALSGDDLIRAGRTVMDNLVEDLRYAVADSNLTFVVKDMETTDCYGMNCSEINLMALTSDGTGTGRSVRAVQYWVEPVSNYFRLVRGCREAADSPDPNWHIDRPVDNSHKGGVALYVAAFRAGAPDADGVMDRRYLSAENNNRLPAYVDIYLELLDANSARQAGSAPGSEEFVDGRVVRFSARVAPLNRFSEDAR